MDVRIRSAHAADSRIELIGPVRSNDMPTLMASLDALVLPSLTTMNWREQFGRVLTEAMASGVPVIASNSGAITEVVGDAGIIVDEGSTEQLASALRKLYFDLNACLTLKARGLVRVQTVFSPRIEAEKLHRFWSKIVDLPKR